MLQVKTADREMVLASSPLSLGTPLRNPKAPPIISHPPRLHHVRPLSLFQFGQFSSAHLSNQLRNCRPRCLSQSQSQPTKKRPQNVEEEEEEEKEVKTQQAQIQKYEFERLFSNLNQATLKREPGNFLNLNFFARVKKKFFFSVFFEVVYSFSFGR